MRFRGVHLLFISATCVVAFAANAALAPGAGAAAPPQSPPPRAFILVDADSGRVLAEANDHQAMHPASTAKLLTALTAIEHLPPNAMIKVSALDAGQESSKINMLAGQEWHLDDVLASVMMVSANDAAYALAENTSGTVANFAVTEAQTAKQLGMRDSTYSDPAGLDDSSSFRGGPLMSAYDIAISARNTLAVPELATFAGMHMRTFVDPAGNQRTLPNHNKMLPGEPYAYPGMTGMKTGYTERADHTFVGTATRNGRTMITVVLGTWDVYGWAAKYLDQGFATPPNAPGTGETLPPVRVSPYGTRIDDRTAFTALTTTTPKAALLPAGPARASTASTTATPSTAGPAATPSATPAKGGAGGGNLASTAEPVAALASHTRPHRGWFTIRNVLIGFGLLLIVLVVLRRRAVKRRRARRLAQRRSVASAMRRGTLQVVDGRYRTGTRVGPPVDSNVRVLRSDTDGEAGNSPAQRRAQG
jgi:D-alanyl-D-alanine carboxypeptidase (penicillin-binding protein 5/6)